jgi:hypothetical protein
MSTVLQRRLFFASLLRCVEAFLFICRQVTVLQIQGCDFLPFARPTGSRCTKQQSTVCVRVYVYHYVCVHACMRVC